MTPRCPPRAQRLPRADGCLAACQASIGRDGSRARPPSALRRRAGRHANRPRITYAPTDDPPDEDEAELRAFFERVIVDERARADDPAPQKEGAAPKRRKKGEEEAPPVEDHDLFDLYDKLFLPNLDKAADPEAAVAQFLALPPAVQQALGQHVRAQGTYERFVARLGLDFARATSENAPAPNASEGEDE